MAENSLNLSQLNSNKVKAIIDQEFDTEILLKHKDLSAIENEIGKAEAQLTLLKKYYQDKSNEDSKKPQRGRKKKSLTTSEFEEPSEFSRKYTQLLSILNSRGGGEPMVQKKKQENVYSPVSSGYMTTRSQASSLRPVARMRPSTNSVECRYQQQNKCICRRSDNVLVSLQCAKCGKTDFLSPQGFINHCRIAHMIDILSHDHAAMTCGTLLPKSEQDDEGLKALENLEKHGLDPSVNLNKPDLEDYAKTNTRDPLASIGNIANPSATAVQELPPQKKRKSSSALSLAEIKPAVDSPATMGEFSKPKSKEEKKEFIPKYSHLKSLLGDKVSNFESLVSSTTEKIDIDLGDDDLDIKADNGLSGTNNDHK
ncbi:hypothetical protein DASC09_038870 [Saccharomycopsis crataegensis]|uniref:Uncharacterized protein n=1 Tax=Saccharomycopsis crataegensis TaxID=43959 RepID=A0AAV5QPX9_9ASCO|nr:hypothetical protein DASC09_038870 [Saccharomycopsis crataegensis]